jgi:hypothetical protein
MASPTEELRELRETSRRLVAHSVVLRHSAEAARKQGVNLRETAQALRTHGEACRTYAEVARKRQDDR